MQDTLPKPAWALVMGNALSTQLSLREKGVGNGTASSSMWKNMEIQRRAEKFLKIQSALSLLLLK